MARIPLQPIGSPRAGAVDPRTFDEHRAGLEQREDVLTERRAAVHDGWGPKYRERVHQKGKLTVRERLERLKDGGSQLFELGTVRQSRPQVSDRGWWEGARFTGSRGGDGIRLHRGPLVCMVIGNDNTVASGSWWPRTPEKIERAQWIALRLGIPTIYLVDCSGLFLPEQSQSFSGARGAGHIFKKNAELSAAGVPQIAGVFGDCIAGGGYMPIISDRVYMTEQAYMVIAGAALIKGAKSQKITSLDIGGPEVHVHASGCADIRVPDDDVLLDCLRREVQRLPSSGADFFRGDRGPAEPAYPTHELAGLLPVDHREAYEAEQVIARLCDHSLFWEVMPDRGTEMLCGVGLVGGLYAGIIMNRQGLVADPDREGGVHPAGVLYREGIAKISAFSRACNSDGLPIIWLQDISGFDIGREAERQGLLAYGSSLIYTNSTNDVPMFTVLLRKASGAGYYAMSGLPYDPVVQLSTTISRLAVMEGRTLAIAAYNTKLDDDFEIVATDETERAAIASGMEAVEERIESDMDPYKAASQMDSDEIIKVGELRSYLAMLVEAAYQNRVGRRTKNPRIWSLHDLASLVDGVRS